MILSATAEFSRFIKKHVHPVIIETCIVCLVSFAGLPPNTLFYDFVEHVFESISHKAYLEYHLKIVQELKVHQI
jgi:hypothetical protein